MGTPPSSHRPPTGPPGGRGAPTHAEAVKPPGVADAVGGGGAGRWVMRWVPQGGGGHCGRRVLRRVLSVAGPGAALRLGGAGGGGELALEQGDGPAASSSAATTATSTAGGVQVRGDTERADAESAALAGRAARPRHRHDEGGRHAEGDEEILAVVVMLGQGRSRPRRVLDDEGVHVEGAGHRGGARRCRSAKVAAEVPARRRRCLCSGAEQKGPWRGLVLKSPRLAPLRWGFISTI